MKKSASFALACILILVSCSPAQFASTRSPASVAASDEEQVLHGERAEKRLKNVERW